MEDYPRDHDPAEAADGNLDLDENLLDRAISVTLAEMSQAEKENESASLQDASIAAKILKEKLSKSQPSDLPGGFSQDGGEFFRAVQSEQQMLHETTEESFFLSPGEATAESEAVINATYREQVGIPMEAAPPRARLAEHVRCMLTKWTSTLVPLFRNVHSTVSVDSQPADRSLSIALLKECDESSEPLRSNFQCKFIFWDSASKKNGRELRIDDGQVVYSLPATRSDFTRRLAEGDAHIVVAKTAGSAAIKTYLTHNLMHW